MGEKGIKRLKRLLEARMFELMDSIMPAADNEPLDIKYPLEAFQTFDLGNDTGSHNFSVVILYEIISETLKISRQHWLCRSQNEKKTDVWKKTTQKYRLQFLMSSFKSTMTRLVDQKEKTCKL